MDPLRLFALLVGLLCGYALARWLHLGGPEAGPLAWEVLAATLGAAPWPTRSRRSCSTTGR